jgi:putative flippase GtrA
MWNWKRASARLLRLLRSGIAGLAATGADVGTLTILVTVAHWSPRAASVPALLAGAIVNFVGNREYAFHAHAGDARKQVLGYTAVEGIALVLNGLSYELVLRFVSGAARYFWLVRLFTSNFVFLAWSYPLWKRVFRAPGQKTDDTGL